LCPHRALILSIGPPPGAYFKHRAAVHRSFSPLRHCWAFLLSIALLLGVYQSLLCHLHNLTPRFIPCRRISCVQQMLAAAFGDLFVSHAFIVGLPCVNFIKSISTFIECNPDTLQ
jgi:hypothetical protein